MSAPRVEVLTITAEITDAGRQQHSLSDYPAEWLETPHPDIRVLEFECCPLEDHLAELYPFGEFDPHQ